MNCKMRKIINILKLKLNNLIYNIRYNVSWTLIVFSSFVKSIKK